MADYGLRIINANGYIQIDGAYSNMALSQSGVMSFASAPQMMNGAYYQTLTIYGISPVVALRSSGGGYTSILGSSGSAGSGTFNFTVMCSTRDSVTYYVFDDARLASKYNTNYGLIVRNVNTGNVVFDSRSPYMRVIGTMTGDRTNNQTPFPMQAAFSSNEIAVIQTMRIRNDTTFYLPGFPPLAQPVSSGSFVNVSNNVVTLDEKIIWTYAPSANNPDISDYNGKFLYFVVDVSGF